MLKFKFKTNNQVENHLHQHEKQFMICIDDGDDGRLIDARMRRIKIGRRSGLKMGDGGRRRESGG